MVTGTIKNAVRQQAMEIKWQQKKNDINAGKPKKEMTREERMLSHFKEQMAREQESNAHADTYNKLKSGGKLTPEEESYLQEHDPEALRKYKEDRAEKAAYERELKNCKTKDDVERVKMNKLGNFVAQAKKITNDPYIPIDKKLELMNQMNNKLCLVEEAHEKFVKSKQYQDMPSDAEVQEERTQEALEREDENPRRELSETEEFSETGFEEDPEEKMKKAKTERKLFETDTNVTSDGGKQVSFEQLKKDIQWMSMSFGESHGTVDLSI